MPIINRTPLHLKCQYYTLNFVSSAVIIVDAMLLSGDSYCNCTILS